MPTIEGAFEFDFTSKDSGKVYHMRVTPTGIDCNCSERNGGRMRANCKHRTEAQQWLKDHDIVVVQTREQVDAIFARFERSEQ